ncbi:MAG: peptidylprolyl isomerase, partial [Promethearchaeia archaeon]
MGNQGKVRASHILVDKHSRAVEIINKIKEGASFKKMAKEHSECPSRKKGGDLGYFARGKMVKPFEQAVFDLTV